MLHLNIKYLYFNNVNDPTLLVGKESKGFYWQIMKYDDSYIEFLNLFRKS